MAHNGLLPGLRRWIGKAGDDVPVGARPPLRNADFPVGESMQSTRRLENRRYESAQQRGVAASSGMPNILAKDPPGGVNPHRLRHSSSPRVKSVTFTRGTAL